MRRLLKNMRMKNAKTYQANYRKPKDAEEKLKKLGLTSPEGTIIGFLNESSPRSTANAGRLRSLGKHVMINDKSMYMANTFGLYV